MAENQREEQEKMEEEMTNIVEKQEDRLLSLQSNAFKLANVYFVFQGIILAAIYRPTALNCSQRWFPFSLSLLSGIFNLVALLKIGLEYVRTSSDQHNNRLDHQVARQKLKALETSPQHAPETSPRLVPSYNENRAPDDSKLERSKDGSNKAKYILALVLCFTFFTAFLCVTLISCWRIPCRRDECQNLPVDERCINLCDGANAKCISVCREF